MKAKELIYNLRTVLATSGSQTQFATDQHIMYMLDEARATLASQKMDRGISLDQMSQILDLRPVKASLSEIGTVGDISVLKVIIPNPISYSQGEGIFTVGSTDGQDSYTRITFSQLRTVLSRKYTASTPKWFKLNDAIYIINSEMDGRSTVRIRGIFDEPYKVEVFMGRYKYLKPFDWEYPLTFKDAKTVYQIAMDGDLGWGDTAVQAIQRDNARQRAAQKRDNQDAEI